MEYSQEERRNIDALKMTILDKLIAAKCPVEKLPEVGDLVFRWLMETPTRLVNGQEVKILI